MMAESRMSIDMADDEYAISDSDIKALGLPITARAQIMALLEAGAEQLSGDAKG
jgi:hypothetical protein